MIPLPRPGTRHGDCPNCGYRPESPAQDALNQRIEMMVLNHRMVGHDSWEQVRQQLLQRDGHRRVARWQDIPIPELTNEDLLTAYSERLNGHGPITEADGLLMSELVRRGLRLHP